MYKELEIEIVTKKARRLKNCCTFGFQIDSPHTNTIVSLAFIGLGTRSSNTKQEGSS